MWRTALIAALALLAIAPLAAQETEHFGPPPLLWAVPHLQLHNSEGATKILRGLDASLALPLSPRTNVTATYFFDREVDDFASATFNYDHPLREDVLLRGSVGMIRDDFGYGLTVHRSYEKYGVGAFAQSVDGSFEGGLMLTREVPWGVKLGKVPLPRRSESSNWNSGAGDVGDLGACAALGWRSGHAGEIATTTAYFPQRRQSWPREGHSVQSASYSSTEFAPPAKPAWRYQTEGPVRSSAAIVDGVAYVGSYDGWLYALDVLIGRRLWRFPAESAITGAPAVADDEIFFGTEAGEVFCVAQPRKGGPPTGRLVWRYKTSAAVTASPLVTDSGLVIVGSCDSYLYALDRRTGNLVWRLVTGGPVLASASKVRRIPAGVDASGKATSRSASVLVGSSDGKLYAIEEVGGQVVWTFTSDGPITAAPVLSADRLYLTTRTGSVYSLQAATGRQQWVVRVPGSIAHSPAVDDQRVYVGTTEGGVFAMEATTGKMTWQCDLRATLAASPTLVSGQLMYLASRDGRLWTMDRPTGKVVNFHRESEPLTTCAAIADGHLLVGGDSGSVYAYVPGGGGPPLPPLDAADVPQPVRPVEPDRSLPAVTPAVTPPAAAAGPTVTAQPGDATPLPPGSSTPATPRAPVSPTPAVATVPAPVQPAQPVTPSVTTIAPAPQPVVLAPSPAVATPPAQLTPPATPAGAGQPSASRAGASAPADFPPAVSHPDTAVVTPAPQVITPGAPPATPPPATLAPLNPPTGTATPAVTPPAAAVTPPAQGGPTAGAVKPPPAAAGRTPLLTLLVTPADGRIPTLLVNQSYLFVGGKIAAGSDVQTIRVNGLEAPIRNGEYQMQVTFPGVGDYLLLVEAITRSGERSTYRRSITVVEGMDAVSPNRLTLRQRGGSPIVMLTPGTRGLQVARFTKTIEIRNAQGQLVHNWSMSADDTADITWNGANADGRTVATGNYEITYILSGENGPIVWLRQPIEMQE